MSSVRTAGQQREGAGGGRIVLAGIVCLFCCVPGGAASVVQTKTLGRFHDPVILRTSFAPALAPLTTASFRLFAVHHGELVPIPYQFDARDEEGDVETSDSASVDFVLDDNDELVFMAKDTGDRIAPTELPAAPAVFEVEVVDSLSGEMGWAYLIAFGVTPPPASPIRYVSFDRQRNEARTDYYAVSYDRESENLNGLRVQPEGGGSGRNLLYGTRMLGRPTFKFLLARWTPEFTEQTTGLRLDGIKVGPVRAIRRLRLSIDLGTLFPELPRGKVDTLYYMSSFVTPAYMSVPKLALKLLEKFSFESVIVFRPPTDGMRYWDGANPAGLRLDEKDGARIRRNVDHDWWVISGGAGTFLHSFLISERWRSWGIVRGTVFKTSEIGVAGGAQAAQSVVGYSLLGMTGMREGGRHEMRRATVILPKRYERGDEGAPMAMLRHPPVTSVRRLAAR